jgi:phage virion morphogenesis protein
MSGVAIEVTGDTYLLSVLGKLVEHLGNINPALHEVAEEVLLPSTEGRFKRMVEPTATPWAPLSPEYARRKKRNADKILTLYGDLRGSFRYQIEGNELEFGTDKEYAAIHQFGGTIQHAERDTMLLRGSKGNKFISKKSAKRRKSWTFQDAHIGAHETKMPARPFLGISGRDRQEILAIFDQYLLGGGA